MKVRVGLCKKNRLSGMLGLAAAGMLVVACLSGCGGEFAGKQGDGVVSGSAVSGQAVSGAAVNESIVKEQKLSGHTGNYTYCNDRYLYYDGVDELIGRNIDTGKETTVKIKNMESVCYADNDWVYYTKEPRNDKIWEEVWRVPVKKGEEWELDEQGEELLLQEKEGFDSPGGVLCDGRYIVYMTGETYRYRQYNIEKKAYESCKSLEERDDYMGTMFFLWNGAVFIDYQDLGLIRKRLDHDEVEKVTSAEYENIPGSVTASETELFYRSNTSKESSTSYEEEQSIWQYTHYSPTEGELYKFIDMSEIETVLKEEGLLSCPVSQKHKHAFGEYGMFVSGNRLYIQIFIKSYGDYHGDEPECQNMVILSKETGSPSGKLRYEKQLSGCLENPEGTKKAVTKMRPGSGVAFYEEEVFCQSRGLIVMMFENKCLMYVEDPKKKKNRWACYDLDTGEFRYITEKDREWYMRYYDCHNSMLDGRMHDDPVDMYANDYQAILYMMPNNYDV